MSLIVKTSGDAQELAPLVRAEIRDIDPDQALLKLMSYESVVAEAMWGAAFFSRLMWIFAVIAAVVAAVGIYGVTAYSVSRRTHELGVRLALGAPRSRIMRMVVRQSMAVVLVGVVIGLGLALAQGVVLGAVLGDVDVDSGVDVSLIDPFTYAGVTLLVLAVGLGATWLPARRTTRLDPVRALRDD